MNSWNVLNPIPGTKLKNVINWLVFLYMASWLNVLSLKTGMVLRGGANSCVNSGVTQGIKRGPAPPNAYQTPLDVSVHASQWKGFQRLVTFGAREVQANGLLGNSDLGPPRTSAYPHSWGVSGSKKYGGQWIHTCCQGTETAALGNLGIPCMAIWQWARGRVR